MFETSPRYKYVPFNKGSLCIIKNGTMKFTRPSKFNDPFDCDIKMDEHKHSKYMQENRDYVIDKLGLSPDDRIQNEQLISEAFEIVLQNPKPTGQRLVDDVGICSLSRDPLNLLMWAHYAKDHTGFVVEFCIPTQAETDKEEDALKWLIPREVKYEKERPIIDPYDGISVNFKKQFLVKGHDWAYEQEERVLDCSREPGIHPYERKIILKSVIAGMRMCSPRFEILKNTVEAMNAELGINVAVYKAESLKGKFALSVPGRDDLSPNPARTHA